MSVPHNCLMSLGELEKKTRGCDKEGQRGYETSAQREQLESGINNSPI